MLFPILSVLTGGKHYVGFQKVLRFAKIWYAIVHTRIHIWYAKLATQNLHLV